MSDFWKNNIVAVIGLSITIGALLIHVGVTKGNIESSKKEFSEFKIETKEKIRDMEILNRVTSEKVNEKLDDLNKQVAVVVSWIEEQKRQERRP